MKQYQCPKCNHTKAKKGEIRVAGGFWSKIFNMQREKFVSVSCQNCGYTEFYKATKQNLASDIFNFLTN